MPRSNWKGVISFGLVTIPIVLYPVVNKAADISFHQIDRRNNARIRYQRINTSTGKEVPWEEITRGYEYDKDVLIPVPDEVLKRVAGENARAIDIEEFINKKDLDILTIDHTYYLVPDKKGDKGYVILREALASANKIGIAKVIISTKEYLAAVMPHEKALILCLLKYDKEMRSGEELNIPTKEIAAYKVNKKEIDIAKKLIESMTVKWKPEKYVDEYQAAIHKWVDESAHKLPHTAMKQRTKKSTDGVDLMQLLKKSLASGGKTKSKPKTKSKIKTKPVVAKTKHRVASYTKH